MKFSISLKFYHLFRRLYNTAGHGNSYMVLFARENRTNTNRVGLTVSKKLGCAVVRNRVRRRLREAYRLNEEKFRSGWDIVVVARHRCISADFEKLENAWLSLAQKAGFVKLVEFAAFGADFLLLPLHLSLHPRFLPILSHLLCLCQRSHYPVRCRKRRLARPETVAPLQPLL